MDGRILFVDDDKEDCFLIAHAFTELQCPDNILFLCDGADVLPYLETLAPGVVRLIVLDMNMPVLGGTETLRLLKQHAVFHTIPVLILSNADNRIKRECCMQLGAIGFREKPTRFDEYLSFCHELQELAFTTAGPSF